jgi:hypothetical protein
MWDHLGSRLATCQVLIIGLAPRDYARVTACREAQEQNAEERQQDAARALEGAVFDQVFTHCFTSAQEYQQRAEDKPPGPTSLARPRKDHDYLNNMIAALSSRVTYGATKTRKTTVGPNSSTMLPRHDRQFGPATSRPQQKKVCVLACGEFGVHRMSITSIGWHTLSPTNQHLRLILSATAGRTSFPCQSSYTCFGFC